MAKRYKVGIIRVITTEDESLLSKHGKLIENYFPQIETRSVCIQDKPKGLYNDEVKLHALPEIVETAKREFADMDGIIISCADDPGVSEVQKVFPKIPVVGAGTSILAVACRYGDNIGVIGITDKLPAPLRYRNGFKLNYIKLPEVSNTLDFFTEAANNCVIETAKEHKHWGADAIILACTGMSTIGIAKAVEQVVGIPVIDAVLAEGLFMYYELIKKQMM